MPRSITLGKYLPSQPREGWNCPYFKKDTKNSKTCRIDPVTGECSLKSTAMAGDQDDGYGTDFEDFIDWTRSKKGYGYCPSDSCGSSCESGYHQEKSDFCGLLEQRTSCKSSVTPDSSMCCTAQLPTSNGGYDSYNCYNFVPWGSTCVNDELGLQAIQNFCSALASDSDECTLSSGEDPGEVCAPRLKKYANCWSWCKENTDACQDVMSSFCKEYPQNPACQCVLASTFGDQSDLFTLLQEAQDSPQACWWSPCTDSDDPSILVPPDFWDPTCPDSVCTNVVAIIGNSPDINIDQVDQYIACDTGTITTNVLSTTDIILIVIGSLLIITIVDVCLWYFIDRPRELGIRTQ